MPRPEGIATKVVSLSRVELESIAGTNAPTRGDCDFFNFLFNNVLFKAGTNAPTRGDCDLKVARLLSPALRAGTNAPTRGDCDRRQPFLSTVASFGRNECPDQRGLRLEGHSFTTNIC